MSTPAYRSDQRRRIPTAWTPGTTLQSLGQGMVRGWHSLVRWLDTNTFSPLWLPPRWRHPLTGYLVAVVVQGAALLLTVLLVLAYPGFPFPGVLALLGIVVVALTFGAGPSLLSTAIASVVVDGVVVPLDSNWPLASVQNGIAVCLLAGAGIVASVVASQVEHARRVAEAARRDRETFLVLAAHELRTPLMVVQGSAQHLTRRLAQAATAELTARDQRALIVKARPVVARIEAGVERMDRLIEEMLTFAAIQAGEFDLRLTRCALAPIVMEAASEQSRRHPQRDMPIEVPDDPVMVLADADRIRQVVTHFISNALKFAPEDQPITVRLEVRGGQARVCVLDQGPGLSPDVQERLWQPFYRAPGVEVQSGSYIGLGVGLYLCRMIVARHHGLTGVESVRGQGATFWFTLPLARDES